MKIAPPAAQNLNGVENKNGLPVVSITVVLSFDSLTNAAPGRE